MFEKLKKVVRSPKTIVMIKASIALVTLLQVINMYIDMKRDDVDEE